MCYPKPGPRCSYHAKKQVLLIKNKIENSKNGIEQYIELKEKLNQAELDYDSTPAGIQNLKTRIEKGNYSDDSIIERLKYCMANRKAMLESINEKDKGDIHTHKEKLAFPTQNRSEFYKDEEKRLGWNESKEEKKLKESYTIESGNLALDLTNTENKALNFYTGSGSFHINTKLRKDSGTYNDHDINLSSKYSETEIKEAIEALDSLFARKKRRENSLVVYRGLNEENFPHELSQSEDNETFEEQMEKYPKYAEGKYVKNSIHTFPEYLSTTVDPGKVNTYAGSDVIMEIKTRSAIPLGFISTYGEGEKEMLVQRNRKFKVIGVKRNVEYGGRNENSFNFTVIQLEEIEN